MVTSEKGWTARRPWRKRAAPTPPARTVITVYPPHLSAQNQRTKEPTNQAWAWFSGSLACWFGVGVTGSPHPPPSPEPENQRTNKPDEGMVLWFIGLLLRGRAHGAGRASQSWRVRAIWPTCSRRCSTACRRAQAADSWVPVSWSHWRRRADQSTVRDSSTRARQSAKRRSAKTSSSVG